MIKDLFFVFAIIGWLVLITGFLSITIERIWIISRPIIFLVLGLILGPEVLQIFDPYQWLIGPHKLLKLVTELTMCIALMALALRTPLSFIRENKKALFMVLGPGMFLMWLSSSALTFAILGFPLMLSILIGAIITPTDPVLATAIVSGKVASENLPERLRHLISAEAGFNDGFALPFVYLPMLLITIGVTGGLEEWSLKAILQKTGGAILLGAILGWPTARLMGLSEKYKTAESSSLLSVTLSLTLLVLGLAKALDVNSILATFIAGLVFDRTANMKDRKKEEKIQEAVNQLFTSPIFFFFGMLVPLQKWFDLGAKALFFVGAIFLFRRLPAWLIIGRFTSGLKKRREMLIAGWFGPIGAAAIFYALDAKEKTHYGEIWEVASLIVFSSIIIHGATASPMAKYFKKQERKEIGC